MLVPAGMPLDFPILQEKRWRGVSLTGRAEPSKYPLSLKSNRSSLLSTRRLVLAGLEQGQVGAGQAGEALSMSQLLRLPLAGCPLPMTV